MDFAANKRELRCRTSIDNDYVDSTETRLPRHLTMERIDHVSVSFLASRDSLQHTSILMQREPSFLHSLHETVFEMTKMMKRETKRIDEQKNLCMREPSSFVTTQYTVYAKA